MFPLKEVPLAGFSLGSLLVPKGFTVDVHRSHVPLSFTAKTRDPYDEEHTTNTLFPQGTTFNTVRLEEYKEEGALLYVTELFLPHLGGSARCWDAAAVEEMMQRSQGQDADMHTWVTPVVSQPRPEGTEIDTRKVSLSDVLGATDSVFVVLTVMFRGDTDAEALSQMAEEMEHWIVTQYERPLSELSAYHRFFHSPDDEEEEEEEECEDRLRAALSLPCSPLTLSSDWPCVGRAAVRSKRCGGLLLLPRMPCTFESMRWGGAPMPSATTMNPFSRVKQDLGLLSEDLFFCSTLQHDRGSSNSSEQMYALCTLPLDLTSSGGVASVFNYLSIETSFELRAKAQHQWSVRKLESSKRYVPSAEVVQALEEACQEEAARRLSSGHPAHSGDAFAAFHRQHPIAQRHTTYQIEPTAALEAVGAGGGDHGRPILLAQLYNPLCTSDHAVVVLTMQHPREEKEEEKEGAGHSNRDAPQPVPSPFALQIGSTAEWTYLSQQGAGFLFRQGQLVLRVPAGDPRYGGTRVVPTTSQLFTSLGSMTAEVVPVQPPAEPQQLFDRLSATWTVVSDGSSADDYLEDIIAEYMYDTGNYKKPPFSSAHPYFFSVMEKQRQQKSTPSATAAARCVTGATNGATSYAWLSAGRRQCLYVLVRESGIGQLLLVEASVDISCRPQTKAQEEIKEGLPIVTEKQRKAFAEWIDGIAAVVIPRFL